MSIKPIYYGEELPKRFLKQKCVGGNGDGVLFLVDDTKAKVARTLKIASNNWKVTSEIRLLGQKLVAVATLSPHMIRLDRILTINCRMFAKLEGSDSKAFFSEVNENETFFPRRAFLMEPVEGDMTDLKLNRKVEIAFRIQCASVELILEQTQVIAHGSIKYSSAFFKPLGPEDTLLGKAMADFDFWKYTFGNVALYIPKPPYVVKLGNFDSWTVKRTPPKQPDPLKMLGVYTRHLDISLEELQKMFLKPKGADAKVLEVFNSQTLRGIQPFSNMIYRPKALEKRFLKQKKLGSGGEGVVFLVEDTKTQEERALKIANNNWRVTKETCALGERLREVADLSPHMTRLYEVLSVECHEKESLGRTDSKTFFSRGEATKKPFPRRAFLMEVLEGDLRDLVLTRVQKAAFCIQLASLRLILEHAHVAPSDFGKYKNSLYKELDREDTFQGKVMADFEFWKYSFEGLTFYIPEPTYVFKAGDFDSWKLQKKPLDPLVPLKLLEVYLEVIKASPKDLEGMFPKPKDADATVLEIFDSKALNKGED